MLEIQPCIGCNKCKDDDGCIIEDDMDGLVDKLKKADAVVLGPPISRGRLNAQAYLFIDRLYALLKPDFPRISRRGRSSRLHSRAAAWSRKQ